MFDLLLFKVFGNPICLFLLFSNPVRPPTSINVANDTDAVILLSCCSYRKLKKKVTRSIGHSVIVKSVTYAQYRKHTIMTLLVLSFNRCTFAIFYYQGHLNSHFMSGIQELTKHRKHATCLEHLNLKHL